MVDYVYQIKANILKVDECPYFRMIAFPIHLHIDFFRILGVLRSMGNCDNEELVWKETLFQSVTLISHAHNMIPKVNVCKENHICHVTQNMKVAEISGPFRSLKIVTAIENIKGV